MRAKLAAMSQRRLIDPAGSVSSTEMEGIGQAIAIQLDL